MMRSWQKSVTVAISVLVAQRIFWVLWAISHAAPAGFFDLNEDGITKGWRWVTSKAGFWSGMAKGQVPSLWGNNFSVR